MTDARDVVVVGGGINGVGVAQAAAAAGHSVRLLEKQALAAGTSSKSSKLIHGGLRYLESYEFSLVHESLDERARLLRLAPDLVCLERFHIPIYSDTRRRPWLVRIGLSLYALLGGLRKEVRFTSLPRSRWDELDGLVTDDLDAVFQYHDAQTDDAALTAAVMNSAVDLGAELAMPAELTGAELTDGGCLVHYVENGAERSCEARVLVNAAGPWVNRVLGRIQPAPPKEQIDLVQGSHLVVRGQVERGIYYVESPRDGRAIFVMPWKGATMVGTTETKFRGDPDEVEPLDAEKNYLIRVLGRYFPRYAADAPDAVIDAFAGLRVLPAGPGHAFHRTREVILHPDREKKEGPPRVLTIYGGKLTSYRATAEKVMERIAAGLPDREAAADTKELRLRAP
ncbi:MAG: FAD-dependent oxidoreductase [Gemmatimonadetes bacterium]|uniref:FAD-dependent oxidoreductase n=1 Tax=Candidatus Kutchimonas denitrificans TaxID=3056748 RepID=A0AAE4Z7H1_9BACT|nr:FAD-dependent oxidoreductase [Gemmatimonadota bacterium]NIR75023.1 FAD-dependent oxidoreductase [Candidatus Kutchimonas denitrificans]NIS01606.1 FAD-dependent oxidoreductase [Gemmatimonadota bacterium]NIT67344.1 FAD-dependent oxidoreductase [Gemmatimonadota bacterium]NIU52707.1 FAD-dependent oxidoreductase [Gemmatimonadota bacterium]